jgi:hypothetical protein
MLSRIPCALPDDSWRNLGCDHVVLEHAELQIPVSPCVKTAHDDRSMQNLPCGHGDNTATIFLLLPGSCWWYPVTICFDEAPRQKVSYYQLTVFSVRILPTVLACSAPTRNICLALRYLCTCNKTKRAEVVQIFRNRHSSVSSLKYTHWTRNAYRMDIQMRTPNHRGVNQKPWPSSKKREKNCLQQSYKPLSL